MKMTDSTVTFWFYKDLNPKNYVNILNSSLSDYFFEFNTIGVPANIDPGIPRLTASSISNHSSLEISLISAKLITRFDENFCDSSDLCFEYLKERVLKIFDVLVECGLSIVYTAIFINLEKKSDNAVEELENVFLKKTGESNIEEFGIRISQKVNDKFYKIESFNNSKHVQMQRLVESNNDEIIFPLLSLEDADEIENYLDISLEVNDRYAFNLNKGYLTSRETVLELIEYAKKQLEQEKTNFSM